eukprot:359821-Chlamydomonas_euryale.AAC.7
MCLKLCSLALPIFIVSSQNAAVSKTRSLRVQCDWYCSSASQVCLVSLQQPSYLLIATLDVGKGAERVLKPLGGWSATEEVGRPPFSVDHRNYTTVIDGLRRFLLEIATVLGASGATVQGMTIQGDNNFECVLECPAMFDHDFENMGRCFRFLLKEGSSGEKLVSQKTCHNGFPLPAACMQPLAACMQPVSTAKFSLMHCCNAMRSQSAGRVASVLYMLDLVAGKGYQPTSLSSTPDIFGRT